MAHATAKRQPSKSASPPPRVSGEHRPVRLPVLGRSEQTRGVTGERAIPRRSTHEGNDVQEHEHAHEYELRALRAERDRLQHELNAVRREQRAQPETLERLALALSATGGHVWEWELGSGLLSWSDEQRSVAQRSSWQGPRAASELQHLVHPSDLPLLLQKLQAAQAGTQGHDPVYAEFRVLRPDGTFRCLEARGHLMYDADGQPVRILGFALDVTARQALQAQLLQAQRTQVVSRLSGSLAHDFNNVLTVITANTEFMLEDAQHTGGPPEELLEIKAAVERAEKLTQQLLAFSRRATPPAGVFEPDLLLTQMERMLRCVVGDDISLQLHVEPSLGQVHADPQHIEQVLMNLAANARDAMPSGGTLTVSVQAGLFAFDVDAEPEAAVTFSVEDSGKGMDERTLAHIFEPFFTTKSEDQGTGGLGLSVVYGLVMQNGGHISAESVIGRGSVFRVALRRVKSSRRSRQPQSSLIPPPGGNETVLVVESEDRLRKLMCSNLEQLGYRVIEAADPAQARSLLFVVGRDQPIHLVVSSLAAQDEAGRKLAEVVRAQYPDTRVLLVCSHRSDVLSLHGLAHDHLDVLHKPFSTSALARRVRALLDQSSQ